MTIHILIRSFALGPRFALAGPIAWGLCPLARRQGSLTLDITAHWTPTVRAALGYEAAERIADMKKQAMAETAEQLLVGTG